MEKFEKSIKLIKHYEGLHNKFYVCPAGFKTIGWGHVILPNENIPNVITNEMAEEILISDIKKIIPSIFRLIKYSINNNQFNALISFCYNLGAGTLQASTLRRKINRGEIKDAGDEFLKWVWCTKPYPRKLKGLILRRRDERILFLS